MSEQGKSDLDELRERMRPKARSPIAKWFEENPEAKKVVDLWLEMLEKRETRWGLRQIVRELAENHDFPFGDATGVGRRLKEMYGDRYTNAMEANHGNRTTR